MSHLGVKELLSLSLTNPSFTLYKQFIQKASRRLELQYHHFKPFLRIPQDNLIQKYFATPTFNLEYKHFGSNRIPMHKPEPAIEEPKYDIALRIKEIESIEEDLKILDMKLDDSTLIQKYYLMERDELALELEPSDLDAVNTTLKIYLRNISTQRSSTVDKFRVTKSKLWKLVSILQKNQIKSNTDTFTLLLIHFNLLNDAKAVKAILNKISSQKPESNKFLHYSILDSVLVLNDSKLLTKIHLDYELDPYIVERMIKFWVYQNQPNPCFKILKKSMRKRLPVTVNTINYLLDACKMLSPDPEAGKEMIQLILPEEYQYLMVDYYKSFGKKGAEFALQLKVPESEYKSIAYCYGILNDQVGFREFVKKNQELDYIVSYLDGYLEEGKEEEITEYIKDLRSLINK
ncbi:hypothetical protein HDV04_000101 [Boothiomyces sp. JEL0838]|nr:hypothetical protein HDV04_000101 [Boothiomyces sp. JEL0838]